MASAATTQVTAEAGELKEVYAAAAGQTETRIVNESGSEVDLFINSEALAMETLPASGLMTGANKYSLVGDPAKLRLQARCRQKLSLRLTIFT